MTRVMRKFSLINCNLLKKISCFLIAGMTSLQTAIAQILLHESISYEQKFYSDKT